MRPMDILVGMSGGVDSSVTAAMLKAQGHHVTGVSMSRWREGNGLKGGPNGACYGPEEPKQLAAAAEICRRLDIDYRVFDCSGAFEAWIVAYFRQEYLAGRTPNPCIKCNAEIKFALLPERAREAGIPFTHFATGHYARVRQAQDGRWQLLRARDLIKDQSYFLCRLTQEQLARQLFPLGEMEKTQTRQLARDFGLQVSEKPDSQDFYSGDTAELLGEADREGEIVDDVTGEVLGRHAGYWKYTIGQRRGLGVASTRPLYVTAIEPEANRVRLGGVEAVRHHALEADDFNWVSIPEPTAPLEGQLKVRSVQKPVEAVLKPLGGGRFAADFPDGIYAVTPGQSAVLYQGDILLGGGVIRGAR